MELHVEVLGEGAEVKVKRDVKIKISDNGSSREEILKSGQTLVLGEDNFACSYDGVVVMCGEFFVSEENRKLSTDPIPIPHNQYTSLLIFG